MNAADVMVSKVITVGPTTTIQEVASILLANQISAVLPENIIRTAD